MIRNIWAIGRNYADHAKELGNQVPQAAGDPMVFLKAGTSLCMNEEFQLPTFSKNVHFETELVLKFGTDLEFSDFTLGMDLTARDAQDKAKAAGQPWTLAKSFKNACLLGEFLPLSEAGNLQALTFTLKINGEMRQSGNTKDMIHPIEKIRRYIVENFPVVPGDIVMTGTPAGVAQLHAGDQLEAEIPGVLKAQWRAAAETLSLK
jgi:acylpyruvate hydrolase